MNRVSKTIIDSDQSLNILWHEIWDYRELFLFLAWRNVLVKYKKMFLGVLWILLKPLLLMGVFTLVFSNLAKFPSQGIPYPLIVYTAMLPWQFFSSVLMESADSIIVEERLISKVYFPRIIIPSSYIIAGIVDLLVSTVIFVFLLIFFKGLFSWKMFFYPVFVFLLIILTMGMSYLFACLCVRFRDLRFVIAYIVQLGMYISPIGYIVGVIPDSWRWVYNLNPMVGIIEGFRWVLLGEQYSLNIDAVIISVFVSFLFFFVGTIYFLKNEKSFTEMV